MVKLPGPEDIAIGRPSGARPIANYEVGPLARGLSALAAGTEARGQAMRRGAAAEAAGLAGLGEATGGFGNAVAQVDRAASHWEYHSARADYITNKIDVANRLQQDRDWRTMPERYGQALNEVSGAAAEKISDSRMRERFQIDIRDDQAQFAVRVAQHARSMEGSEAIAAVEAQGDKFINQGVTSDDAAERAEVIDAHNALVDGLAGRGFITPQQAVAMRKTWAERYASADVLRLIDKNPAEAVRRIENADEKSIYGIIPPEQRYQLLHRATGAARSRAADGLAQFKKRVEDAEAEAMRSGIVIKTVGEQEFKATLGDDLGARAYEEHRATVQLGTDIASLAALDPGEQRDLIDRYAPPPGPGYAMQAQRQDVMIKALGRVAKERDADPGGFAIARLPAAREAWGKFAAALADSGNTPEQRREAARHFASVTLIEQARVGIPAEQQRIMPASYTDALVTKLNAPQASGGASNAARAIQTEAELWGPDLWPQVYAAVAPKAGSLFRVIGSGVAPHAATALVDDQNVKARDLLAQQDREKAATLRAATLTQLKPFAASLRGHPGGDQKFKDFHDATEKLAAVYVARGATAEDAAQRAFNDLVGFKYEFRDDYRIPKTIPFSPDVIQAGAAAAKQRLAEFDLRPEADIGAAESESSRKYAQVRRLRRDGVWVTDPDERGLVLINPDTGRAASLADGKALALSWDELARYAAAREKPLRGSAARYLFGGD